MYSNIKLNRGQSVEFTLIKDGEIFQGRVSYDPNRYIHDHDGNKLKLIWIITNSGEVCTDKRMVKVI